MAWKPKKKKHKPLSYAEQQFVKKLIEDAKAKRKTLRGHAIIKLDGQKQDVKISGTFKDEDELKQCANEFAQLLSKKSGKTWNVVEIVKNSVEACDDDNDDGNANDDI